MTKVKKLQHTTTDIVEKYKHNKRGEKGEEKDTTQTVFKADQRWQYEEYVFIKLISGFFNTSKNDEMIGMNLRWK